MFHLIKKERNKETKKNRKKEREKEQKKEEAKKIVFILNFYERENHAFIGLHF